MSLIMHLFFSALLLSIKVSAAPSNVGKTLQSRDDASDIGILTSYFGYDGCSDDQKKQVTQAQKDAVMLAANAVKNPGINWGSDPAAIDFFGPADETQNRGTRQHIIGMSHFKQYSARYFSLFEILDASLPPWPVMKRFHHRPMAQLLLVT